MYKRILNLPLSPSETCFLWGSRQTGKSTLLRTIYPDAKRYDLLLSDLTHRGKVNPGSELFGRAFEHLIYMELTAHSGYSEVNYPITYWKTASGFEVDFVLGDHEIA